MRQLSHDAIQAMVETDRAHNCSWTDVPELNYWARRIGFQKSDSCGHLREVDPARGIIDVKLLIDEMLAAANMNESRTCYVIPLAAVHRIIIDHVKKQNERGV